MRTHNTASAVPTESAETGEVTVLFVAAMGGLGGPVKRLATLLANMPDVYRVLIKPRSELLDARMRQVGSVDEHIPVHRSAQRSYLGSLVLVGRILVRAGSRKRPIDVIHANGIVEFALCWPAALLFGKPVVTWVGNYESPLLVKRVSGIFRTVSRRTRWNAISSTAVDAIAGCKLVKPGEIQIVTNIVDPADVFSKGIVSQGTKRLKVGYLQVAQDVKGFDLLPSVIAQLSDIHDLVQFLLFAKRNDHPTWAEIAALPPGLVEVRSRTANVGDIYAECDIVFSPSRRESFNRVVAEALTTGTPVVASDLEAVRQVVGDAGLLFPVDDVSAASACLRQLILNADLRASLGIAGVARSKAWLPGPVAAEFLAQYRSLANRGTFFGGKA